MVKNIFKKNKLKQFLSEKGFRINNRNIEKLSIIISEQTLDSLEKVLRNARISGRKTLKEEDFEVID